MKRKKTKEPRVYDVTLRRDVQQIVRIRVDACSRQEAIDVAESLADAGDWAVEEHIGSHKPEVRPL